MKRFNSLATVAALAGSLLGAGTPTQASSTLYLVPISPLNAVYQPGDIVRFAAVVDLTNSSFASLSIPFATAWIDTEFGGAANGVTSIDNQTAPFVDGQPTQIDPNGLHGATVFNKNAQSYTTTTSKINGNVVYTVQNTVGQRADVRGVNTFAFPAGTYTLGTFSFPIAAHSANYPYASETATIYLPTPYGFSNSANSADGAFSVGTGPLLSILGKDVNGNSISEPITFPAMTGTPTNGKYSSLTYNVGGSAIFGVIDLGLAPNAPPQPITIVTTSHTTQRSQTYTVLVGQVPTMYQYQPNFSIGVPPDVYDVTIQGSKWLKKSFYYIRAYVSPIYGGTIYTTLSGGDANGDNSVDSSDFGILIGAYGSDASIPGSGYDPTADFNCDGMVDSTDFGILIGNFNETGSP